MQWSITQPQKEENPVICDNKVEPEGYYTKWNEWDGEK